MPLIRIPFEGIYNFRDLGGYAAEGGEVAFGRVFRCDALHGLSPADREKFRALGIKTVIDLRTKYENERHSNDYRNTEGINFVSVSPLDRLFDFEDFAKNRKKDMVFGTKEMLELYKNMLEHSAEEYRDIVKTVARFISDPLVFHCSEGKDRTGLTAALLYGICGVEERDIIANYQVSHTYISEKYLSDERYKGGKPVNTPPELMRGALDFIAEKYGGIRSYLLAIGVSEEELSAIKKGMLV